MKHDLKTLIALGLAGALVACASQEPTPEPAAGEPIQRHTAAPEPARMPPDAGAPAVDEPLFEEEQAAEPSPSRTPDVVYVPTPQPIVDRMLQMAKPKKGEVLYDLGCGDGRIVITAARDYGVTAKGFDIDPKRVEEAKRNVEEAGLSDLVTIEQADIFELDLSPADVVTLYLLPELNVKLIPQLSKLAQGARVVSHDFDMQGVAPAAQVSLKPAPDEREHEIYLWHAPIRRTAGR